MKRAIYIIIAIAALAATQAFKGGKKTGKGKRIALIVAIANYNNGNPNEKWGTLSSLSDDTIITETLKKQGFDSIIHVTDAQATIDGIRNGFKRLQALTAPGDVVYIHFSSHGQQIWDDNHDEIDGLDECIVTYDAPMRYHKWYKGEKHLRDDELGKLVNGIRKTAGPEGDVWVVSDACHSGTALRGPVCRGTESAMMPPDSVRLQLLKGADASVDEFIANDADMAPVVLFSASRAFETNQEYNGYGSLSFAISKCMSKLRTGDSYNTFFAFVNNEMAKWNLGQVPMIEGSINHPVFGGNPVKQAAYYEVKFVKVGQLTIDAGTLSGLFPGSKIAVMPAGSTQYDSKTAIYEGTIANASMSRSLVLIDKDLSKYKEYELWVFVTEQAFGSEKITVGMGDGVEANMKNTIKNNISKLEYVKLTDDKPELTINFADGKYYLQLADGRRPFEDCDDYYMINTRINDYMQGKIMSQASFNDPDLHVDLTFVPKHLQGYDLDENPVIQNVQMDSRLKNGSWELIDDDLMLMRLINNGKKDAYINIIEIDPAGKVSVVVPYYAINEKPSDYLIKAGDTVDVKEYMRHFTGPRYGKYIYKVFATDVPISFANVFNTRDAAVEYKHPAEQFFAQTFSGKRNAGNLVVRQQSGAGTTTECTLRLNPKK